MVLRNNYKYQKFNYIMKKKVVSIVFIGLFLSILIINLVSAINFYEGMTEVWNNITKLLTPVLQFFFGDISGGLFLNKILIFIIILSLAWVGLKQMDFLVEHKLISKVLVFAISILAIKGIGSSELIDAILIPYTTTGVAISAGLPFILYFFLINKNIGEESPTLRKTAWIFFAVIFFGLLASRIGGFWNLFDPSTWGIYWIYILTAALALAMAFLDGTIKAFFLKVEADKLDTINKAEILAKLGKRKEELNKAEKWLKKSEYKTLKKKLRRDALSYGIKKFI